MTRYVLHPDGELRHSSTGEIMPLPERDEICAPMVMGDIPEYRSPIDGKMITSRTHRRYDLESNGCQEADPPKKPRGYINESFAKPRGLKLREDAAEVRANLAAKSRRLAF